MKSFIKKLVCVLLFSGFIIFFCWWSYYTFPIIKTDKQVIILYGKPASGKGTQAKFLKEHLGFYTISSGETLRECVADPKCKYGEDIKDDMNSGKLVKTEIVQKLLLKKIKEEFDNRKYNGIIFDGYPRDEKEISFFISNYIDINKVFDLQITDEEAIKRISKRKDSRADDKDTKAIQKRLDIYNENSKKLKKLYKKLKIEVVEIDGMKSKEEISLDIVDNIEL